MALRDGILTRMASLLSLEGRESRLGFWRLQLAFSAATAAIWCAGIFAVVYLGPWAELSLVILLPVFAMILSVTVRRLHYRSKGLLWIVPLGFGPYLLLAFAEHLGRSLAAAFVLLAALGLWVWGWAEIGFMDGADGANRFGPDPRAA